VLDKKLEIVTCDGDDCSEQEEFFCDDFKKSAEAIKKLGWKIVNSLDGWKHFCSRCSK